MAFAKILKTRQYFKRYQTKFRRRRENKTDYYARKRMVRQDCNKYGTPKYRLIARFSNTKVITQVAYSTITGDHIICEANSAELKKHGLTTGGKSYAAAYATGLLIARRLLNQFGLEKTYAGAKDTTGENYDVTALAETYQNAKRPFKVILDIGLTRSTIGNRVYAVLKGALDGGLNIPHNTRKYFGSEQDEETKKYVYYPEAHRDRIFGCHIDQHMTDLKGDTDAFNKQFSNWSKCLKAAGVATVEALFTKIHAAVRANPVRAKATKKADKPQTYEDAAKTIIVTKNGKYTRDRKISLAQRKANLQKKIADAAARLQE